MFRKHLKPFGFSNSQVSLLFVLSKCKIISQRDLGGFLYLEKSTVNRNLSRIFEQNLIQKTADNKIEITKRGVAQVLAIIPVWEVAMSEARELLGEEGMESLDQVISNLTN